MPLKATLTLTTISRSQNIQNINIKNANSNANDIWFKKTLQQLIINQNAFKAKFNAHNHQSVKMPLIKWFTENKFKLKEFFTQVKIQINNKVPKLPTFKKK